MEDVLSRYASKEMVELWSNENRHKLWRKIWHTIAGIQHRAGVSDNKGEKRVTEAQWNALIKASEQPINYGKVAEYEKKFKHDVMAHIHAFGDAAPEAKDVIHLGATSCDITDNADLILIRQALGI